MLVNVRNDLLLIEKVLLRVPLCHQTCVLALEQLAVLCADPIENLLQDQVGDRG